MLIIINSCVKVMYSILSTSLPCSEGSRNMLPSEKGSNRHRLWCSPGILRYREYYITFVGICQPRKSGIEKIDSAFFTLFFNRNHPISRVGLCGKSVGSVGNGHGEAFAVFARDAVEPLYLVIAVCHSGQLSKLIIV